MAKFKKWYRLDNAAKLYPAVASSRWSSIFRVSAELTEEISPALLQKAVDRVLPRFPSFKVRMRKGFFWYYLEEIQSPLPVLPDEGHPCMPFRFHQNNGYLLRVFYFRNRISAEFFHSLTDGSGGLVFIKTLTAEYLRLCGHAVSADHGALDLSKKPTPDETNDAFTRIPLPKVRIVRKESRAYQFPATPAIPHTLHTIAASMPADRLLQEAKKYGVSLTEYLVGIILYVSYLDQAARAPKKRRPLRVSVPVNMRSYFPTATLRNFSSFINPAIDPRLGEYSFEEICTQVHAFMRYSLNKKLLCGFIATNVADEKNPLCRIAPLFVKNLVIGTVFRRAGEKGFTSTLTNLGRCDLPTGAEKWVRRLEMQLGSPSRPLCNCAAVTCGNDFRLVFSSNISETTLPRLMLRFLVEAGIPVEVESNLED